MLLRHKMNRSRALPLKSGRFTPREKAFVKHMAATSDPVYAATKAGLAHPRVDAHRLMQRPAVKNAVMAEAERILRDELLPLALETHKRLLSDKATPAGAQVTAVKLAYDRTLGVDDGKQAKEPSEMTYDELQASIEELQQQRDSLADQARDVTPVESVNVADPSSVFD
jgi:hypothetical protein